MKKPEKPKRRIRSGTVWDWLRDEETGRVRTFLMPHRVELEKPPTKQGVNPYDKNK
jgi:hypothetical protein